jgi:hypothetical protein
MPANAAIEGLKTLGEDDIRRLFEEKVFARGVKYFEQGRIRRPFIYRDRIMAECHGTLPEDYSIRVDVLDGNFIASCSCAYAFGHCKHIAAVLYAWLKRPGMFKDLGQSEDLLRKMDSGSLVDTIMDMIKYDPDVAYVINLRLLPRPDLPAFVKGELDTIFSESLAVRRGVREIVRKLDIFREYASDIHKEGDIRSSMVVLETVIDAMVENYTRLDDRDSLMRNFFSSVLSLYGDVLSSYCNEAERRGSLGKALDWYMGAEWGLERVLRKFLQKQAERLREQMFMLDATERRLAGFKKRFITMGSKYSEEYEYIEERLERLEGLLAGLRVRS